MGTGARILTAAILMAVLVTQRAHGQSQAHFSSESRVVVLHIAVRDDKGHVGGLNEQAFRILENKQPQPILFFNNQDTPATVGLLIDSSGSMGANRARVIAAGVAFAQHSNPDDDMFVLGFNEHVKAPLPAAAPFTRDIPTLRNALESAMSARGLTAVYDAVNAGVDYLNKGKYERKVLVLVSDGGDNASSVTREQILAKAQASNAVIYTVRVIDPAETEADPGFLKQLAAASGGQSFEPQNVAEVEGVLERVARDIRSMYTIGYEPATSNRKDELRRVSVSVTLPSGRKASVRTRRAYLAGEDQE